MHEVSVRITEAATYKIHKIIIHVFVCMKCAPKPQAASRPDPQYAKSPHLPQLAASRQNG